MSDQYPGAQLPTQPEGTPQWSGQPQAVAPQPEAAASQPQAPAPLPDGTVRGLGPFTVRELIVILAGIVVLALSFFSNFADAYLPIWSMSLDWVFGAFLPAAAAVLLLLRRLMSRPIQVGSLSVDQFASVAFSVGLISWIGQVVWTTRAITLQVTWVTWVAIVVMIAGLFFTVFASIVPPFSKDFAAREESVAHKLARPALTVYRAPKPQPVWTPPADPMGQAPAGYGSPYGPQPGAFAEQPSPQPGYAGQPGYLGQPASAPEYVAPMQNAPQPAATALPQDAVPVVAPNPFATGGLVTPAAHEATPTPDGIVAPVEEPAVVVEPAPAEEPAVVVEPAPAEEPAPVEPALFEPVGHEPVEPVDEQRPAEEPTASGPVVEEHTLRPIVDEKEAPADNPPVAFRHPPEEDDVVIGDTIVVHRAGRAEQPTGEESPGGEPAIDQPISQEQVQDQAQAQAAEQPVAAAPVASQPFWGLAPSVRTVYDASGQPLFQVGPTAWALVLEDRGDVFVVRDDYGRVGFLYDTADVTRG